MGHVPRDAGLLRTHEHLAVARSGALGRITVNRPAKMNALTHRMVGAIDEILAAWADDDAVRCVAIDGAGPSGLCAGGDIRDVYDSALARDGEALRFWADEYRLDLRIATYRKPIVAFMTGTVMGGGVGISAHASHRVVSASTRLAMPEVDIGFIPDIGATWLLSRAPGELGTYLALTGARIGAPDAIALGLADRFVAADALEPLLHALEASDARDGDVVRAVVDRFASERDPGPLPMHRALVNRAFAHDTVDAIVAALQNDGSSFALAAAEQIAAKSPTSLALTLRALRRARTLPSLPACLQLEYRVMSRLYEDHDPVEGVRAAVVDKDRRPHWRPATLAEIDVAALDRYFAPLGDAEWTAGG